MRLLVLQYELDVNLLIYWWKPARVSYYGQYSSHCSLPHAAARLITAVFAEISISPRHCTTRYIGCQYLSAFCSKSPWWRLTVLVVKDQATLMMSLCQFTLSELVHHCDLPITAVTWPSRVIVHISFPSAQLPLICTISVERPSIWTEEQRH